MKKIILIAAAALALPACGSVGSSVETLGNTAAKAVDGKALISAVNQSIDRQAVEGLARNAVAGAVQEAIPPEVRAVGAVVNEQALVSGVDRAIDVKVLEGAMQEAVDATRSAAGQ